MQELNFSDETLYRILAGMCIFLFLVLSLGWWRQARKTHLEEARSHTLELDLLSAQTSNVALENQLLDTRESLAQLQSLRTRHAQLEVRYEESQQRLLAEKNLLQETRQSLFRDFQLAASQLVDQGQEKINLSGKQHLEAVIKPLKQQLENFNQRVEDVYHKENSQRNQLVGQIVALQKHTQNISAEANNLASALKGNNKSQGNWGEMILERLLEQSGLVKGREYDTQSSLKNADGKVLRPDVIVHLPENKDVVIDSKVSLLAFEAWSNAEDKSAREKALKEHQDSIRSHVRLLSSKNYDQLEDIRSLDFVFLFMPIDEAYTVAMQTAPDLFKETYEKNVIMVSPASLMVALRTVETLWRYDKQNKNAEKIAASAGRLYDQFALFVDSLDDIGKHLDRASESWNVSRNRLISGRGNILKRVEDLKQKGAKTSKRIAVEPIENDEEEECAIQTVDSP